VKSIDSARSYHNIDNLIHAKLRVPNVPQRVRSQPSPWTDILGQFQARGPREESQNEELTTENFNSGSVANPSISGQIQRREEGNEALRGEVAVLKEGLEVPNGIIGHLTRQCDGNVHDRKFVEVNSVATLHRTPQNVAKHVADLEAKSRFTSEGRNTGDWIRYDFKDRRIMPTHCVIRSWGAVFRDGEWSRHRLMV
jgi:hypothetical protein